MCTFGLSFVGRFVIFQSVLYQRFFHCIYCSTIYSPPRDVVGGRDSQDRDEDKTTAPRTDPQERDETPPSRDDPGDGASQEEIDGAMMTQPHQAGGPSAAGGPPTPQHDGQHRIVVAGTFPAFESSASLQLSASGASTTSTTALLDNSTSCSSADHSYPSSSLNHPVR